jgi:hypothetical protein
MNYLRKTKIKNNNNHKRKNIHNKKFRKKLLLKDNIKVFLQIAIYLLNWIIKKIKFKIFTLIKFDQIKKVKI